MDFLGARPNRVYRVGSGILCRGGLDLGATFVGHEDMQLHANVVSKTILAHFTFYHTAAVVNPNQMILAEDIFLMGYVGGEELDFQSASTYNPETRIQPKSVFSLMIPYGCSRATDGPLRVANPMSITGRFDPAFFRGRLAEGISIEWDWPLYPSAFYYNVIYAFDRLEIGMGENEKFVNDFTHANVICWRTHQWLWNRKAQDFTKFVGNTCPMGPNVYAGVAGPRKGMPEAFLQMDYAKNYVPGW